MKRRYENDNTKNSYPNKKISWKEENNKTLLISQPLFPSQGWLFDISYLVMGRKKISGLCFGVAVRALAAAFSGQLDLFVERFHHLYHIFGSNALRNFDVNKFKELSIEGIAKELNCPEERALDFRVFIENLVIAQTPFKDKDIYPEAPFYQDPLYDLKVTLPITLDNHTFHRERFVGSYTIEELTLELQALKEVLQSIDFSIYFILRSGNHAVFLVYHKGLWKLIDANRLPILTFDSEKEIAKAIIEGFSGNGRGTFCFEAYVEEHNKEKLEQPLKKFLNNRSMTSFDYNQVDSYGNGWLLLAAKYGDLEGVQRLINSHNQIDVNCKNSEGYTALTGATQFGHSEIIQFLLDNFPVDVNCQTNQGATALIIAAQNGYLEIVQQLLERPKTNVNSQANGGVTALIQAAKNGHFEVVRRLLKHPEINVNSQDKQGATALMQAAKNGYLEIVKQLLKQPETHVNSQTDGGVTALMLAAQEGHLKVLECLLDDPRIDVNCQTKQDVTVLMVAVGRGHLEIVRRLLAHPSICASCRTKKGYSALDFAEKKGHSEVAELLKEHLSQISSNQEVQQIENFKKPGRLGVFRLQTGRTLNDNSSTFVQEGMAKDFGRSSL